MDFFFLLCIIDIMGKKFLNFIALSIVVFLTACTPKSSTSSDSGDTSSTSDTTSSSDTSSTSTSVDNDNPWADLADDYYLDVLATSGNDLLGELHDLVCETHTHYTTYGETRNLFQKTDYNPSFPNQHIIEFYTQASIPGKWDSGETYDREHVWPKSLSNGLWTNVGNNDANGGGDIHHIRPTFPTINGTHRGNKEYGDLNGSGSKSTYKYDGVTYEGGFYTADIFEPKDAVKGDAARIVLYMFIHYNNPSSLGKNNLTTASKIGTYDKSGILGSLPITNVIDGTKSEAFELLLEWNEMDPPDTYEINRNNAAYEIQGNRNPFIDYPDFADLIW